MGYTVATGIGGYRGKPLEVAFWDRVQKSDGCWLWTGAKTRNGYGTLSPDGKKGGRVGAHRVAWWMYGTGRLSQREVGEAFGVSRGVVNQIVRGKNWASV